MCAIAGVSFAPGSTINRKKFAAALLTEGKVRGRDAAGYAYVGPNKTSGIYKNNVPGDQLYVGGIPQDAESMILHTRASTHGSPKDMANNHPIESPGGFIRLVHNGVIWNHEEVRRLFNKQTQDILPEVDSSVIGAILETWGVDETKNIEGDAAVAWFDAETGNTIHLARFQNSPVHYATLADGSFAFASTASILHGALKTMNLAWYGSYPLPFAAMDESAYFQIIDGEVITVGDVEWGDEYSSRAAYNSNWRKVTSGATTAGSTSSTTGAKASGSSYQAGSGQPNKSGVMSTADAQKEFDKGVQKAIDTGKKEEAKTPLNPTLALIEEKANAIDSSSPMALAKSIASEFLVPKGSESSALFDAQEDDLGYDEDIEIREGNQIAPFRDQYFLTGHDGDFTTYATLGGLLERMSWESKQPDSENLLVGPEEGNVRWVNHFADVGHLSSDGSNELSWVTTNGAFAFYKEQVPHWVNDGIGKLQTLVGA